MYASIVCSSTEQTYVNSDRLHSIDDSVLYMLLVDRIAFNVFITAAKVICHQVR